MAEGGEASGVEAFTVEMVEIPESGRSQATVESIDIIQIEAEKVAESYVIPKAVVPECVSCRKTRASVSAMTDEEAMVLAMHHGMLR